MGTALAAANIYIYIYTGKIFFKELIYKWNLPGTMREELLSSSCDYYTGRIED